MLLRGAKLPTPALDRSDIEILRSKGQRSGRSFGGVPLKNHHGGGRINYGPGGPPGQGGRGRGYGNGYGRGYGNGNGYGGGYGGGQSQYGPPPGWQPPPPGFPGFGVGVPPPPPPAHLSGGYNQGYGQDYRTDRYTPGGYGDSQQYRPPPPPGQDRRYDRPHGGDNRDRNYRDPRGYR